MTRNKISLPALILFAVLSIGSQKSEARTFVLNLPMICVYSSGEVINGIDSFPVTMYFDALDKTTTFSLPGARTPLRLFIAYGYAKDSTETFGIVAYEKSIPGDALYGNGWLALVLALDQEEAMRVAANIYGCMYYRRWYSPPHQINITRSSHNPME